MTVPIAAARFLGAALDRDQLGAAAARVLHLSEGDLGSAGANYEISADSIESFGNKYRLWASGTAGTRGPDIAFAPEWKPLGGPQADGVNNIKAFDEIYIHHRLAVLASSWDGAVPGYVELLTIAGSSDAREHRGRLFLDGAYTLINQAGGTGTPNVALSAGAHAIGSYIRVQHHVRRTIGGAAGRLAVRFDGGAWNELVSGDISPNTMSEHRLGARDVGQNLGTNGHPDVSIREIGWYIPIPSIDAAVPDMLSETESAKTADDFLAYATPDPFALCRTGDFSHDRVKLVLGVPTNALDDGGEMDWELGTVDDPPAWGEALPDPAAITVTPVDDGTATLGATARMEGVLVADLDADTLCAWRSTCGGRTSEWRMFRTAPAPGAQRTRRFAILAHRHSDGRRTPGIDARRAAELYRAGLIDGVIVLTKGLLHMDNNGQRTACITLAEIFENYSAAGMCPFLAELSRTGCPLIPVSDDYDGYPTNGGKWMENIPLVYPGGHPSEGTDILVYTGYDKDGDGSFTDSIDSMAPDADYDFTAGRLITYPDAAAIGEAAFDAIIKQYFLDETDDWRFLQQGAIDYCLLHDRNTRDPIGGAVFLGSTQIDAVTARIALAPSLGVRLVVIVTPSTVGDEDASNGESWASWPAERAAALQDWVDEAASAGVHLSFISSCKNEPAVLHPDALRALVSGNEDRIVSFSFLGKSNGRISNHNASLDANDDVLAAFLVDGVNELVDPLDGGSRTVEPGDHVGFLPLVETDPAGTGSERVRLLDLITLDPVTDATHGDFDVSVALGLPVDAAAGDGDDGHASRIRAAAMLLTRGGRP